MDRDQILDAVVRERNQQDKKWDIQNHTVLKWQTILAEEAGEVAKVCNEIHPTGTRSTHLYANKHALQEELIQTAAVCVAWLERLGV